MASPIIGQAKVDKILSQFSQMYRNDNYIAEDILPVLKVKEKTGKFAKYGKENMRAYIDNAIRLPGTRAMSADYSVSQGQYVCTEKSLEKLVPDEMALNTDEPYEPKRDATAVLMDNIFVNQELALASALTNTAILTQNVTLAGASQWSDYVNSDPISDINTGINQIRSTTGKRPNGLVLSFATWLKLKSHPDVRAQIRYTNGGQISDDAFVNFLKGFFQLEYVLLGDAVYNSAAEGQTDVLTDVWGKNAVLFYRTPSPSIMRATFGLTLTDTPRKISVYREEPLISDVVRIQYSYDQNLFDTNFGYLIKNAVA